ncbi:MAG: 2,3-bisphosphoglycerate-independent phosphoglycerate mutase [Actinobacteria bacterium]|nr:2,3-bisphosphoglycerate-independent phosphoglycerate mutase [Actinomycetota bacterium]
MEILSRKKPFLAIILDGWGHAPAWGGNAISQAKTKTFDLIWQKYPSTLLNASDGAVGLPVGTPGNSEAGHLNIGAGHVVHQDTTLIDQQIEDRSFPNNKALLEGIKHSTKNKSNIHVMGLLSKTVTHSNINHLYGLLRALKQNGCSRVFIHLFSDGRDSPPTFGIEMIEEVEREIKNIGLGTISSVSGRFFAMDRDNRWGRIARIYNMLVKSEGNQYENARAAFSSAYAVGITDEFIEPRLIGNKTQNFEPIASNDTIILFNFRSDRSREITKAFLAENLAEFPDRKKLNNIYFASFVIYDDQSIAKRIFQPETVPEPLARVLSECNLKQFHLAETEKYPHITYFINGGREKPFLGETRLMVPSPKNFKTYDYIPQMSAEKVTKALLNQIKIGRQDCYLVNFANTDMVGHTGNLEATIEAAEFVDKCLGEILSLVLNLRGTAFIFADHGNAEQMVNPHTGAPDTEHTTNPVPFIYFANNLKDKSIRLKTNGGLPNVAPTILDVLNINKPVSMTAESLIIKNL